MTVAIHTGICGTLNTFCVPQTRLRDTGEGQRSVGEIYEILCLDRAPDRRARECFFCYCVRLNTIFGMQPVKV